MAIATLLFAAVCAIAGREAGFAATSANSLVLPVREFLTECGLEDPRDEHMCLLALELRAMPGMRFSYSTPKTRAADPEAELDTAPSM